MNRPLRIFALSLAVASALNVPAQTANYPDISSAALDAYKQGLVAEAQQHLDIALDRFQTSLKLAGKCLDCMEAIARTQVAMGDDKAALATAVKMTAATAVPKERARAEMLTGRIYYDQSFAYSTGEGAYRKDPKLVRGAPARRSRHAACRRRRPRQ